MSANDILFYIVLIAFTIIVTVFSNSLQEHITGKNNQSKEK